jgi:hypothetical protein
MTLLQVVLAADNFPAFPSTSTYPTHHPTTRERYIPLHLTFQDYQSSLPPIGLLRPEVIAVIQQDDSDPDNCPWQFHHTAKEIGEDGEWELEVVCCFFAEWVLKGGHDGLSRALGDVVGTWRDEGKFKEALDGELWMS